MDQAEILAFITQMETEDMDPVGLAEAYAETVSELQSSISERDLKRLLLVGAAMFRNSTKGAHAELQIPTDAYDETPSAKEDSPAKGFLH